MPRPVFATLLILFLAGLVPPPASLAQEDSLNAVRTAIDAGERVAPMLTLKDRLQQNPEDIDARLLLAEIHLAMDDGESAEKELQRAAGLGAAPTRWQLPLVEAALLRGQPDIALERLDAHEPARPEDTARALVLRGRALLARGELEQAEQVLQDALDTGLADAGARLGLIGVTLANRNRDAAIDQAEALLLDHPRNAEALVLLGALKRDAGQIQAAEDLFARALALEPEDVDARFGHAYAAAILEQDDAALADLDVVDRLRPGVIGSHWLRGLIALRQGDTEQAQTQIDRALALDGEHLPSRRLAALLHFRRGEYETAAVLMEPVVDTFQDDTEARKLLASARLRTGDPQRAIDAIGLLRDDGDPQLMALLGSAYAAAGDPQAAQRWLQQAVETAPEDLVLRSQLALQELATGDTEAASEALGPRLDLSQDTVLPDLVRVYTQLKDQDFQTALGNIRALREVLPESPIIPNLEGTALAGLGRGPEAIAAFEQALALSPDFHAAAINLAKAKASAQDIDGAEAAFQGVLERAPGQLDAMLGMAALADLRGDFPAMIDWLRRAQETNPDNPEPGLTLAQVYRQEGDIEALLTHAGDMSRRFPDNAEALWMRATAERLNNDPDAALATLRRIARLSPDDPEIYRIIATYERDQGDLEGALDSLDRALSIAPDYLPARLAKGDIWLAMGESEKTLQLGRDLQDEFPDAPTGYYIEGGVHYFAEDYEEALDLLEQAWERSQSSQTAVMLARTQVALGSPAKAIELLEDRLREQPRDADAIGELGVIYRDAGQPSQAAALYRRTLEQGLPGPRLLGDIARLLREYDGPATGQLAKLAYAAAPGQPDVAAAYGRALLRQGQSARAVLALKPVYEQAPQHAELAYQTAAALYASGQSKEAAGILRDLMATGDTSSRVMELLQQSGG